MFIFLIPVAGIMMMVFWVWFDTLQKRAKIEARTELTKQLLEKFSSAQELTEFLEKESGQRFLDGMESDKGSLPTWPPLPMGSVGFGGWHGPKERILGIIIPGCILTSIGTGFLAMSTSPNLQVAGATILAAGIGLLIAAIVTYVLSKAWGLMDGKDGSRGRSY